MILPHRIPTLCSILLILLLQASLDAKTTKTCPIGFQLSYTRDDKTPICYRLKGPERFTDAFKNCTGNLYTAKLYDSLVISNHTDLVLWTEYRSAYPGGPFVDISFTSTTGSLLKTSFNVTNSHLGIEEELCVAKDPVGNYTAERCDKEYYRYCFVEPYAEDPESREGCEELEGGIRFYSPKPMCLSAVPGARGIGIRATWTQSYEICEKKGGQILYNGWRYSNDPILHRSSLHTRIYPLRVTYDAKWNITFPSISESLIEPLWSDIDPLPSSETLYGSIENDVWTTVNSSYLFDNLICEREVKLENVTLVVKAKPSLYDDKKLLLITTTRVNVDDILCYTDSVTFYPSPVKIRYDEYLDTYVLSPADDGNYWCIYKDSKRFLVAQSNKYLWIREKETLKQRYAITIKFNNGYTLDNIDDVMKIWEKELKDYIYYSTIYKNSTRSKKKSVFEVVNPETFDNTLEWFKEHPELNSKSKKIFFKMKLKELYLDAKTALVHVQLDPTMKAIMPGWWKNIIIILVNPVHYCSVGGMKFVHKVREKCELHSCVGDFNNGVVVVTTSDDSCRLEAEAELFDNVTVSTPREMSPFRNITGIKNNSSGSSEDSEGDYEDYTEISSSTTTTSYTNTPLITDINTANITTTDITNTRQMNDTIITVVPSFPTSTPTIPTTETTTAEATTTTLRPDEQLQQVMDNLEQLLQNNTWPVSDIAKLFDRVNELLENDMSLEIPGRLLHLLDSIGNNLKLNGTQPTREVRNNVALLVTKADPSMPVNGFRIATRETDPFTDEAFQIIRDGFNSSYLFTNTSEAVVYLPNSVAFSSLRISFVVFRNDRAFQANVSTKTVNSRILSINVENNNQFKTGEVIDMYFRPLSEANRNQSRTCGYWKFDNDSIGYWSQDGCTFIEASEPGMMDSCQCTHLTHFAEILVSRTLFSKLDEAVLEILSIIGCCLSILGLTMVGITAILFTPWRRDFNNKIWLQLCLAILLLVICFLITVFMKFKTYNIGCMFLGIILHYSVLASFCWMLVAAVLSYKRLVMVFTRDASHKLLRASAFAWGVPIAVVGILLALAPDSYRGQFKDITPTGSFCYPSGLGLWLAVYAPIAVMLLANWTLFVLILRSLYGPRRIEKHGDTNEAIRCASVSCVLIFLFGLPWIFGLFAQNVVAAYFFAITATFQGFVLFVFFIVGNKNTRDLWLNKLKIRQTLRVPVTLSTYKHRSAGGSAPGWRGGATGTVEAKLSKPKSLSNTDNSRFS